MKDIGKDVAILLEWFKESIGADWDTATSPNVESKLGINASFSLPWKADKDLSNKPPTSKDSIPSAVKHIMSTRFPWFKFQES